MTPDHPDYEDVREEREAREARLDEARTAEAQFATSTVLPVSPACIGATVLVGLFFIVAGLYLGAKTLP